MFMIIMIYISASFQQGLNLISSPHRPDPQNSISIEEHTESEVGKEIGEII